FMIVTPVSQVVVLDPPAHCQPGEDLLLLVVIAFSSLPIRARAPNVTSGAGKKSRLLRHGETRREKGIFPSVPSAFPGTGHLSFQWTAVSFCVFSADSDSGVTTAGSKVGSASTRSGRVKFSPSTVSTTWYMPGLASSGAIST